MVVAKRFRRILVWPNFDIARAADEAASEESKLCNRLTVWPTDEEAAENAEFDEGGGGGEELPEAPEGFAYLVNAGDAFIVNADGAYVLAESP